VCVYVCLCVCASSAKKEWGQASGGSGDGSTLDYTANVRRHLLDVLSRYNVTSMLDSSCGSMIWMPLALRQHQQEQPGFRFMGTDVVCNLTEQHKVTYANESNWQFQVSHQLIVLELKLAPLQALQACLQPSVQQKPAKVDAHQPGRSQVQPLKVAGQGSSGRFNGGGLPALAHFVQGDGARSFVRRSHFEGGCPLGPHIWGGG